MATIGEVGAKDENKIKADEEQTVPLKLYFGVFFDGTGNNMVSVETAKERRKTVKKRDGTEKDWDLKIDRNLENGANVVIDKELENKDDAELAKNEKDSLYVGSGRSNIAILHSCYQGMSRKQRETTQKGVSLHIYNIYVEGAGTESVNDETFLQKSMNALGSGMGNGDTGVVALVSKAIRMIRLVLDGFKYQIKDNSNNEVFFDVFGFSRGAACARLFSYVAGRGSGNTLGGEKKFSKFSAKKYFEGGKLHFLDKIKNLKVCVSFLGIYDTVSSIGLTYDDNVADFGLFSPDEEWVKETIHLCAIDEFRSHFALTDINIAKDKNIEFFMPGCHSDIGGGYQIGNEKFTLQYRRALMSKYKVYVESPQSKKLGKIEDLSCDCIRKLGWAIGNEVKEHSVRGFLTCKREKILAGYSNIPLTLMKMRANEKSNDSRYRISEFPAGRFEVSQGLLSEMYELFEKELNAMTKGRKWVYPEGSYCSDTYKILRHGYLHFSATDETISSHSSIVHSPNIKDGVLCRIVYRGQKGASASPSYMWNY